MGGRSTALGVLVAAGSLAVTTAILFPLEDVASPVSLGVLYLLPVLLVSTLWGLWLGLVTSDVAWLLEHAPGEVAVLRPADEAALAAA